MRDYKTFLLSLGGAALGAAVVIVVFLSFRGTTSTPTRSQLAASRRVTASSTSGSQSSPATFAAEVEPATATSTLTATATINMPKPTATASSTSIPTPISVMEWNKALDPIDGYTVRYPSGWVLMPATNTLRTVTILSWVPEGPGGMDVVPRGGLLVHIGIVDVSEVPISGNPIEVGDKRYPGVVVQGGNNEIQDPSTIRRVYYSAVGTEWLIEGYFGDEVSDSNPNLEIFLRVVKSIVHVSSPAPVTKPSASPFPTPVATQTPVQVPYEYLHPDVAIKEASAQYGIQYTHFVTDYADVLPYMFHLASADVGQFNTDSSMFYPWLVKWLTENSAVVFPAGDWQTHMYQQVDAVFHQYDCQAAQTLRLMAADGNYTVYWTFVIWPAEQYYRGKYISSLENGFNDILLRYLVSQRTDPANTPSFDTYFANSGFLELWLPSANP